MTTLGADLASPGVRRRAGKVRKRRHRRRWTGWGFVGPFLVVFLLVMVAPIVYAIYLSLYQDKLIGGN